MTSRCRAARWPSSTPSHIEPRPPTTATIAACTTPDSLWRCAGSHQGCGRGGRRLPLQCLNGCRACAGRAVLYSSLLEQLLLHVLELPRRLPLMLPLLTLLGGQLLGGLPLPLLPFNIQQGQRRFLFSLLWCFRRAVPAARVMCSLEVVPQPPLPSMRAVPWHLTRRPPAVPHPPPVPSAAKAMLENGFLLRPPP